MSVQPSLNSNMVVAEIINEINSTQPSGNYSPNTETPIQRPQQKLNDLSTTKAQRPPQKAQRPAPPQQAQRQAPQQVHHLDEQINQHDKLNDQHHHNKNQKRYLNHHQEMHLCNNRKID